MAGTSSDPQTLEDLMGLNGGGDDPFAAANAVPPPRAPEDMMLTMPLVLAKQILDQPSTRPGGDLTSGSDAINASGGSAFADIQQQLDQQQADSYSAQDAAQAQADAAAQDATTSTDTQTPIFTPIDDTSTQPPEAAIAPAPAAGEATPSTPDISDLQRAAYNYTGPSPNQDGSGQGDGDFVTDPTTGLTVRRDILEKAQQQPAQDSGGGGGGGILGDVLGGVGHAIQSGIEATGRGIQSLPGGEIVGTDVENLPKAAAAFKSTFGQEFEKKTGEPLSLQSTVDALNNYGFHPIADKISEGGQWAVEHSPEYQLASSFLPDSKYKDLYLGALDQAGGMAPYAALTFLAPEFGVPADTSFALSASDDMKNLYQAYRKGQIDGREYLMGSGLASIPLLGLGAGHLLRLGTSHFGSSGAVEAGLDRVKAVDSEGNVRPDTYYHGSNGVVHEIAPSEGLKVPNAEDVVPANVKASVLDSLEKATAAGGGIADSEVISPAVKEAYTALAGDTPTTFHQLFETTNQVLDEYGMDNARRGDVMRRAMTEADVGGLNFPANRIANAVDEAGNPLNGRNTVLYSGEYRGGPTFDESKLGTGQGANLFGSGLYVTDNPRIAEFYAGHQFDPSGTITGTRPGGVSYNRLPDDAMVQQVENPIAAATGSSTVRDVPRKVGLTLASERGSVGEVPDAAKSARVKELVAQIRPLVAKGGLTGAESTKFVALTRELNDLKFDLDKPLTVDKVPSPAERQSTLSSETVVTARNDLMQNKAVYTPIVESASGVSHNALTPVDRVMQGKDPAVTPQQFYRAFDETRDALRSQYGDTITLYRAVSQQMDKPTTNWATTREYAQQFGSNVVSKDVPVDNVVAVNVGPTGKYHEVIVGKPPTGLEIPPIGGGARMLPEPTGIDAFVKRMPSQKYVGAVIRRVPVFGDALRVMLGGAADRSTRVAADLAGYDAARTEMGNINAIGMARVRQELPDQAFGDAVMDRGVEPNQYHLMLQKTDGSVAALPINDVLQYENLNDYNMTPEQKSSLTSMKQVVADRVSDLRSVMSRLKKAGYDIKLLPPEEDIADMSDPAYFPRKPIGRTNPDGSVTFMDGGFDRGTTQGGLRAGASFLGGRAGTGEYELPDGQRMQVAKGEKVYNLNGEYRVLSRAELAEERATWKEEMPGEPFPAATPVELKPLMEFPDGSVRGVPKGQLAFENPSTGEYEFAKNKAEFAKKYGLDPAEFDPVELVDRSQHIYTTAEMEARGLVYMKPEAALSAWLNETGKRVSDYEMLAKTMEQNKKLILPREKIVAPGTTGVHPVQPASVFGLGPEVTERATGTTTIRTGPENINVSQFTKIPALSGYYAPADLVKTLETAFGTEMSPPAILRSAQTLNDTLRGAAASTHIGTVGIQMMGALAHDMAGVSRAGLRGATGDFVGARASLSNAFGTSWYRSLRALFQGQDVIDGILSDPSNARVLEKYKSVLNPPHQVEYWPEGVPGQKQPLLYRLPVAGAAFKRIGVSFDTALYSAQVEMAKALDRIYPNATPAQVESLGSYVRNFVGALSNNRLGISPTQNALERFLTFSPRFTKSTFATLYGVMKQDIGGEQTRLALGSLMGAGFLAYAATAAELGQTPNFDPSKPGFLSVRVGDNWVGIGGAVRSMGHLIGTSGQTLFQNPKAFLEVNPADPQAWRDNPILNYWRSKASPLVGTAIDVVSGTDFRGTPIHGVADYAKLLAQSGIPIAGKGSIDANGGSVSKAGMGILTDLGLHASPLTAYQMYDQYLRSQVDPKTGAQRFPDGAQTAGTRDYLDFTKNNSEAAHLKQSLDEARAGGTQQQQDIQKSLNDRATKLEAAQEQFNKDHDYQAFRRNVTEIRTNSAKSLRDMNLSSTASTPDKKLVNSWYDLYQNPAVVDKVTGKVNYDVLDKFQSQWRAANPGQYERLIQPSEERGATPTETQLKKDRELVNNSGWWGTDKAAWSTLMANLTKANATQGLRGATSAADFELKARNYYRDLATSRGLKEPDAVASTWVLQDPIVKAFHTLRTQLRNQILSKTPDLLNVLSRWGYTSASTSRLKIAAPAQ